MIVSCEASSKFQRKSFQNDCFVRCFRQFSRTELPKRAFRVMLPTIFTEKTSKTIVSCEAFKFHRTMLPKRAFRTMLPTIFTEKASKMIVSCEASSKFHRTMLPKRAFRAMLPTIFTKNLRFATVFIRQKQNVPRTTAPCIPKFQKVRFATAACAKMYESIDREPTRFAHTKM